MSTFVPVLPANARSPMTNLRISLLCLLVSMFALTPNGALEAAPTQEIQASIQKGSVYLVENFKDVTAPGDKALVALAILKAGASPDHAIIASVIKGIQAKCAEGKYRRGPNHLYEAGVEATLLADTGGEEYLEELQVIANYILEAQMSNGGWDYPSPRNISGDTSLNHYCCLGLWAAARSGVEVPQDAWLKVIQWHVKFQNEDGGFAYTPGYKTRFESETNLSVNGVGSLHIAMMHVDEYSVPFLNPEKMRERPKEPMETPADKRKFGVLETVDLDRDAMNAMKPKVSVPPQAMASARRAFAWVARNLDVTKPDTHYGSYLHYSLERMASLADVEMIGPIAWYERGAAHLMSVQKADGSFNLGRRYLMQDTAFAVLFLTRSTGKLLRRRMGKPAIGDGLLAGGRGLPEDLNDVDFNGRNVMAKKKEEGPLGDLLASLKNPAGIDLADVQEKIVKKVQLGDRESLIGKKDDLVALVDHPDAEVRRTVLWALGRTDDLSLGRYLVNALDDPDVGVMIEARNALCWLSRKPTGFGLPIDPLADLGAGAGDQQRLDAIAAWRKRAIRDWGRWYLEVRPYSDRGDEFEAALRARLEELKLQ